MKIVFHIKTSIIIRLINNILYKYNYPLSILVIL